MPFSQNTDLFKNSFFKRKFFIVFMFALLILLPWCSAIASIEKSQDELLQFTSKGHVLAFDRDGVYFASGDHMLKVEFAGTNGVTPEAVNVAQMNTKPQPFRQVSYSNVWPGIDLTYEEASGGIVESTWHIAAGAEPEQIRLSYSRPVEIEAGGDLKIRYDTGWMSESKPIAWQQIDGNRVPVQVAFTFENSTAKDPAVRFSLGKYNTDYPLLIDPVLGWNTFQGSTERDFGEGIAVDSSGNVYVVGRSAATWGTPINEFNSYGNEDNFVAKFNTHGELQWNTFMGSPDWAEPFNSSIAVDSNDNVYVIGSSVGTWGAPVHAHAGGYDAYVAKLDDTGALVWNTFMGSGGTNSTDYGHDIAVNQNGSSIFVTGVSYDTWGTPILSHGDIGAGDAFVAELNGSGELQWNTFLGSSATDDSGRAIAVDSDDNVYVTGLSRSTWGADPVNAHEGTQEDAFVAKLNADGTLLWNTFMGSSGYDIGNDIAVDAEGNIYVVGESPAEWGADPVNSHSGQRDIFAAKLNGSGELQWNTFMGSDQTEQGGRVAVDCLGTVYVTGSSKSTWGTPWNEHAGEQEDAFVAQLDSNGVLVWNTFFGGVTDMGKGIATDSGNIYVAGHSDSTWGSPINAYTGLIDVLVFKITPDPPQANTSWSFRAITNSDGGRGPVLTDTDVAWSRWDGTNTNLYAFDGNNTSQLTTSSFNEQNLFASDKYITWNSRSPDDIYLYDGTSVSQITNNNYHNARPKVHGEYMAWSYDPVKIYDIASDSIISTTTGFNDTDPDIHGNWVAFTKGLGLPRIDWIYYYDISGDTYHELAIGRSAKINDDYITYHFYDGSKNEVMLYDRNFDTFSQISVGGTSKSILALEDYHILWHADSGDNRTLNDFLLLHNASNDTTKVLSGGIGSDDGVSIDGNRIVYAGYDGDDWEIYIYEIDSGVTTQLTDNEDISDTHPKIRGDRIVWVQEDSDENAKIMLATPRTSTPWILFMSAILTATEAGK
ncbi:MAG: SBBP repeat-containing protein [Desulfopila sp.]|jgi:hypothetical protein|nr:SBBP repeat-containing protein [Desulfopila sp.]